MLGDCFEIGFILLQCEHNRCGIRFVDLGKVDDLFVLLAEDDVAWRDDFGPSHA